MLKSSCRQLKADLALLVITFFWGSTFVAVKKSLNFIGPFTFLLFRFLLSSLLLLPFLLRRNRLSARALGYGAVAGLFLWLGYVFQTIGLKYTTAANSGFITGLTVIFVPLFSSTINKKPVSRGAIFGVALAFAGMGLMSFNPRAGLNPGDLLTLLCTLFFSLQIIAVERFSASYHALPLTLGQIAAVGLLSALPAFLTEQPLRPYPTLVWETILFTALFATVLAFLVQTKAQQFTSATHVALIFTMEPIFALLTAVMAGGETITPRQGMGAVLILTGMLAAEFLDSRNGKK